MLRFPVSLPKQEELFGRMRALQLGESDIEETYLRGNAVSLRHRPSGVRVRCGRERSQGLNRFLARRLLVDELEARRGGKTRHEVKAEKLREEKVRRQHRHGSAPQQAQPKSSSLPGAASADEAPRFAEYLAAMGAYYLRPLPR
ncbi:MAG: peptide chain release factor-like protein [Verrucomicrobia bacterium]|nr:peptide chain release factor-like protein [Verrucomicrobiota bacterium]MBV9656870.1 peptide chain release factor-like protein [Verrucomicrobiota bacterium]